MRKLYFIQLDHFIGTFNFCNFEQNNIYSFQCCFFSFKMEKNSVDQILYQEPALLFLLRLVHANFYFLKWRENNYNKSHSLHRRNAYNIMWFDLFLLEVLQTGSASTTGERNICRPICRYCSVLLHQTVIDYRDAWLPTVKK